MSRPIVLMTDFGTVDPFVGIMKCVIQSIAPRCPVIDLSHGIPAQDLIAAAVILEDSLSDIPENAVVCIVVDPGVGGTRRSLLVSSGSRTFIAPDNGVLTPVFAQNREAVVHAIIAHGPIVPDRSATFHGRDVFAPAAALVARGDDVTTFTESHGDEPVALTLPTPRYENGSLHLTVLVIDRFGNCATNLCRGHAEEDHPWIFSEPVCLCIGKEEIRGLSRTFGDVSPDRAVFYFNSAGRLEFAVNGGNAARRFGFSPGSKVLLRSVP